MEILTENSSTMWTFRNVASVVQFPHTEVLFCKVKLRKMKTGWVTVVLMDCRAATLSHGYARATSGGVIWYYRSSLLSGLKSQADIARLVSLEEPQGPKLIWKYVIYAPLWAEIFTFLRLFQLMWDGDISVGVFLNKSGVTWLSISMEVRRWWLELHFFFFFGWTHPLIWTLTV